MRGDLSPEMHEISINFIKKIKEHITEILVHIFNNIIEINISEFFKIALVFPIYKGGNKLDISNYRPISLLYVFSKIFERAIKIRLLKYIEENTILPSSQFSFRENIETVNALAQLSRNIYTSMEKKKTLCIFMDISKAFDSISHKRLLNIFKSIGIVHKSFNLLT